MKKNIINIHYIMFKLFRFYNLIRIIIFNFIQKYNIVINNK